MMNFNFSYNQKKPSTLFMIGLKKSESEPVCSPAKPDSRNLILLWTPAFERGDGSDVFLQVNS